MSIVNTRILTHITLHSLIFTLFFQKLYVTWTSSLFEIFKSKIPFSTFLSLAICHIYLACIKICSKTMKIFPSQKKEIWFKSKIFQNCYFLGQISIQSCWILRDFQGMILEVVPDVFVARFFCIYIWIFSSNCTGLLDHHAMYTALQLQSSKYTLFFDAEQYKLNYFSINFLGIPLFLCSFSAYADL